MLARGFESRLLFFNLNGLAATCGAISSGWRFYEMLIAEALDLPE